MADRSSLVSILGLCRGTLMIYRFAIISCDIVGHSREATLEGQLKQLQAVNKIVKDLIERYGPGQVLWASRGDGGHVVLRMSDWGEIALRLIRDLHSWSTESKVPLHIIAHYGDVGLFTGADDRTELFGHAINLVGRLIDYASAKRAVVSEAFVQAVGQAPLGGVRLHDPKTITLDCFPPQVVYLFSCPPELESAWDSRQEDRDRLKAAQDECLGWEIVYYAK